MKPSTQMPPPETGSRSSRPLRGWKSVICPPCGLYGLWRSKGALPRKLAGTVGLAALSLVYAAAVLALLLRFTELEIEWRGGYIPAFTYHKTTPDYVVLEQSRAQQPSAAIPAPPSAAYWTGFRGPHGTGTYTEMPVTTNWPPLGLPLLWKQPVGGGYSSFAFGLGLAYTLEQRRDEEAATAYRLEDGAEVWCFRWPAKFTEYYSGDGPRSTPLYADGHVFVLGAMGDFHCLSATNGQAVWSRNVVTENQGSVPTFGCSASPVLLGSNVLVVTSAGNGRSLVTYDRVRGTPVWSALDDQMGYATPLLTSLAGETQIVVCAETRTLGLNPTNGAVLWEFPWQVQHDQSPIAQPVVLGTNRFLLSAGYFTGAVAVEITRTPNGFSAREVWRTKQLKNKFGSSFFRDGYVYGLDEDILTCLDAATGERRWKQGRFGYGQLLLTGDHLIILSGKGELALVQARPDSFHELARFQAISGKTWNYPAIEGGKLLVRNSAEMACFYVLP